MVQLYNGPLNSHFIYHENTLYVECNQKIAGGIRKIHCTLICIILRESYNYIIASIFKQPVDLEPLIVFGILTKV